MTPGTKKSPTEGGGGVVFCTGEGVLFELYGEGVMLRSVVIPHIVTVVVTYGFHYSKAEACACARFVRSKGVEAVEETCAI